jgi:hypothetical protein
MNENFGRDEESYWQMRRLVAEKRNYLCGKHEGHDL